MARKIRWTDGRTRIENEGCFYTIISSSSMALYEPSQLQRERKRVYSRGLRRFFSSKKKKETEGSIFLCIETTTVPEKRDQAVWWRFQTPFSGPLSNSRYSYVPTIYSVLVRFAGFGASPNPSSLTKKNCALMAKRPLTNESEMTAAPSSFFLFEQI